MMGVHVADPYVQMTHSGHAIENQMESVYMRETVRARLEVDFLFILISPQEIIFWA